MPTNYKPGMSFGEYIAANPGSEDHLGRSLKAYKEFQKNYEQFGAVGDAVSGPGSTLAKIQDPLYGLEAFERIAAASTPSYADYAARVASLGGSARQAREQEEAGTRTSQGNAFEAFERFRLGKDSNVLGASLNLYAQQLQNQQFQQQRGDDILNNILGIGGGILGTYLGGKLFQPQLGGGGGPGYYPNPYGGAGSLGTGGSGTPGYPVPGANFGGVQQSGQQRMNRPSGPNPYDFLGY